MNKDYALEALNEPQFRLKIGLATQFILKIRRHARETYDFTPTEFEVFLTVVSATIDKIMRDPRLRSLYGDHQPVPVEELRFVSARAVCAASGMNRETVRRAVNALVEKGWLTRGARGYAISPAALMKPENARYFMAAFESIRQLTARWSRLEEDPGPAQPQTWREPVG